MKIDELKAKVELLQRDLKAKRGHVVQSSETGPIGIEIVWHIVSVLDDQQRQIHELRRNKQSIC